MISYTIGQILQNKKYCVHINNGERYIEVDFVNNYPGYRFVDHKSSNEWYFVAVRKINCTPGNAMVVKGDIIKYNMDNIKTRNVRHIRKNNVLYRKATQSEYDRYEYLVGKKNGNAMLYSYVYDVVVEDNKNRYYEELDRKIKETPFISERNVLVI